MEKFKLGDRVRILSDGDLWEGYTVTVDEYVYKPGLPSYVRVRCERGGKSTTYWFEESEMEHWVDLYEYAMQTTSHGVDHDVSGDDWATLEEARDNVTHNNQVSKRNGWDRFSKNRVVQRRKAGPVEEVPDA